MQHTNTLPPELHRWVVDWAMIGSIVLFGFVALILSTLVLATHATFVSAKTFPAACAPRWILICWLIPIVGPLATLQAAKKLKQTEINLMPNQSPEPTADGAGSSAVADHVASRRWLSFFR